MEKKQIDWSSIGFGYIPTEKRYVSNYKDGKWDDGCLTEDANIVLNECAGVLQYSQSVFEGMKAYTTEDGRIVVFRPDMNAKRFADSARRLEMPVFPEDRFVDAIVQVVKANAAYVPPYGSGASLYIRPYMFGSNPVIGVKPADEYQFRAFVTPVGPYFKGGAKPITIKVSDFDRAAPHGTGHIKAGLNYAMSLHAIVTAHEEGYAENMYLDAATRTKVEETGGANFIFVTKDGKVVTPKSNSILPSITRRSILYVAEHYLGLETEEREVPDYMWIITEEPKNLIHIGRDLTKQARVNKMLTGLKLRQIQDNELFISGMDGKEARNGIIDVCRKFMEDEDGKIMIGNGFSDWGKKEENRQLQWQVLNMAVRQKQKEQVLLVENYYHELAISCISENLGQENIYLEELEILKEEDRKTGKELYKTLYWYLRMKRNVAQTAARLRIHRNTLLPRIARINELLDLDEKDGMECERILMGMEIEKLKND